jgi:hypothetical protein
LVGLRYCRTLKAVGGVVGNKRVIQLPIQGIQTGLGKGSCLRGRRSGFDQNSIYGYSSTGFPSWIHILRVYICKEANTSYAVVYQSTGMPKLYDLWYVMVWCSYVMWLRRTSYANSNKGACTIVKQSGKSGSSLLDASWPPSNV